jgi:hypothetical protein
MLRNLLDPYERKARLVPGMLAVMPATVIVAGLLWVVDRAAIGAIAGAALELGLPVALANHTRRVGKRVEGKLWAAWGGPATTKKLRHRGADNPHRVALVHANLSRLAPGIQLPTLTEEDDDPVDADHRYEAASEVARNRLRDMPQGRLLFAENCSYGYHRNLFALRPVGIRVAAASLIVASIVGGVSVVGIVSAPGVVIGSIVAIEVALLVFWLRHVRDADVEMAADSYAEAFMGAVASLSESGSSTG